MVYRASCISAMRVKLAKQCRKPPMTGNGKHTTYKKGDDWGIVFDIVLSTLKQTWTPFCGSPTSLMFFFCHSWLSHLPTVVWDHQLEIIGLMVGKCLWLKPSRPGIMGISWNIQLEASGLLKIDRVSFGSDHPQMRFGAKTLKANFGISLGTLDVTNYRKNLAWKNLGSLDHWISFWKNPLVI